MSFGKPRPNLLIDRLRALHRFTRPRVVQESKREAWMTYSQSLWPVLKNPELLIVTINGVATFYYEKCAREYWDLGKREHFPDLTPPRSVTWFEFRFPKILRNEHGETDLSHFRNGQTGVLVLKLRPDEVEGIGIPAQASFILAIDLWLDYGITPDEIQGPHGCWALAIDDQGRIIGVPFCQSFTGNNSQAQAAMQATITWIHPPLLALSWLPRELPEERTLIEL
jgi:hypothetical protein